jgi:hypothetical protein
MQALRIADQAASVSWEQSAGKAPMERLRLALRSAVEQLEVIRAALAVGEKQPV